MKKVELIFIPVPGIGHLVSTFEFAKRLIDRDDRIRITILSMKWFPSAFVDAYTKSLAALQPDRIQLIDLPQVDPPSLDPLKSMEGYIYAFVESYMPLVRNVVRNIVSMKSSSDSTRVAGVVLDFFCAPMIDIATELDLPSYIFLTTNAAFLGLMLYLPTRHSQNSSEFENTDPEHLIPGFVNPVPPCVLPSAVFNKDGGYTAYAKVAERFMDAKGIMINSFEELEPYALNCFFNGQNPPIYPVGPVLDLNGLPQPDLDLAQREKVMTWLDDQPQSSVVFLCFGSMGSYGAPQVKEVALGLEQSGYRFLWSLRMPPPPQDDATGIINYKNPEDILPEGFMERIQGRGMICGWAPQVEVLAHKAIGGFVSHCGWNSILESLWFGVPIVTWPMYAEQQLNAFKMVKELGLAVEMRLDYRTETSDLVMADEIEKAVRLVMDGGSEVRKKVKEMAEMARKAVMKAPGMGHLVSTLEFAKRLIHHDDRISITILSMKLPFTSFMDAYTESAIASELDRIKLIDLPQVELPSFDYLQSPGRYIVSLIDNHIPLVKYIVTNILSLQSISDSTQFTGLVLDFLCAPVVDIANELNIPSYIFLTANAGYLSLLLYLTTRHSQNSSEFKYSDPDQLIPGFINPVPPNVLPSPLFDKDSGYPCHVKIAQRFKDVKGIMINTFEELEPYAINYFSNGQNPPVGPVGPVLDISCLPHPDLDLAQRDKVMTWLDDQPQSSVVFLCFGSYGSFGAPQVKEMALGLEQCGYRFLWSLRVPPPPPQNDASGIVHYKNPLDMLPEGFLERIQGRGMICGWAPQVEVLAHKAIGGFVSHCGWNSILESLWFGVPIITWPMYHEQQLNAFKMVKELGLAVELRLEHEECTNDLVMADEIEKAVRQVMDGGSEVRKKVKEMAGIGRKAIVNGGSSFISIGRLIEDMLGNN
ncbi:hypothetical protein CRYUN_Cryun02cG0180400 [Craigia yunnanensis]